MSLRILVLGGTRFLGRHVADAAIARGHAVTLFHRGLSDHSRRADVEHVLGDRTIDLSRLADRRFDVVIDTSGYEPRELTAAAAILDHPGLHYVFVSTISVYADPIGVIDESAAVRTLDDPDARLTLPAYGALKAACERVIAAAMPGRVRIVRPGLIVGPHDADERFRWWLTRIATGGEVLAPGVPERSEQFVDVRDLAAWLVDGAEPGIGGVFNATGPGEPVTMRSLLDTMRDVVGGDAVFRWVPDDVLEQHAVGAWSEMPFWMPADRAHRTDASRAIADGLRFRSVETTVRDAWDWIQTGWDAAAGARDQRRMRVPAGMTAAREAEILRSTRSQGP